ncbi:MAG: two-component regulator propeller domain-containing protein [Alistipes senegalensis]
MRIVDPRTDAPAETDGPLNECIAALSQSAILSLTAVDDTVYIGTQGDNLHQIDIRTRTLKKNIVTRGTPGLNYTSDFSCCFRDSENNFWIGTLDRGYSVRYANEKELIRLRSGWQQTLSKFVNAITISKDGTRWIGSRFKGMLAYTSQLDLKWHTLENCAPSCSGSTARTYWRSSPIRPDISGSTSTTASPAATPAIRRSSTTPCFRNAFRPTASARTPGTTYGWRRLRGSWCTTACACGTHASRAATCRMSSASTTRRCWRRYFGGDFSPSTAAGSNGSLLEAPDSLTATALRHATCLLKGRGGRLWIGTRSKGLLRYHPTEGFRTYTLKDGFASNEIASLAQDRKGDMWVATSYGLSLILSGTERIITYLRSDKMQTQQFHPRCVCQTSGMLYFGGNLGLVHFRPESVLPKISERPVRLVLRELKVNSVAQHPSDDGILTQQLDDTERIVLDHKQRNLDISYEALAFLSPRKSATPTGFTAATSTRSGTTSKTAPAPTIRTCPRAAMSSN